MQWILCLIVKGKSRKICLILERREVFKRSWKDIDKRKKVSLILQQARGQGDLHLEVWELLQTNVKEKGMK